MGLSFRVKDSIIVVGDAMELLAEEGDGAWGAIITDPPYGIDKEYGRSGLGHRRCKGDEDESLATALWPEAFRVLAPNSWALVFAGWTTLGGQMEAARAAGFGIKSVIAWDKGLPGLGMGIRNQWEVIICARKGMPKEWYAGGNVWRYNRIHGRPLHPNQKPIGLLLALMERFVPDGASVLDPFCGSGTTLVAAQFLRHPSKGFEVDERFARVSAKRVTEAPDGAVEE